MADGKTGQKLIIHPLVVRLTHWINAFAIICLIMSGWHIYNASPLFDFRFPNWMTLGGWLAGALAWHFAAMWLLMLNGLIYLIYGFATGHFRRTLLPLYPRDIWRDVNAAMRLRLAHVLGRYNAVQRIMYAGVILLIFLVVLSGLVLWKPVQLHWFGWLMGDYEGARLIHFLAMSGIVLFIIVHLVLIIIVPSTLKPMITGRASVPASHKETKA